MLVLFGMYLFILGMGGWSFLWKILLGLLILIVAVTFYAESGSDYSDPNERIRMLEDYQHSLGNINYTYEKDCADLCEYWIKNNDGTIDKIGGKRQS